MSAIQQVHSAPNAPLEVDYFGTALPPELLVAIFDLLSQDDGISASHTNKYWHDLFWSNRKMLHIKENPEKTFWQLLSIPKLELISVAGHKSPGPFLQALANTEGFDWLKIQINPEGGYYSKDVIRRYLIGENLAKENHDGLENTSLHLAIEEKQNDLLPLLLESNKNLETRNDYDFTPLMHACWKNNTDAIETLIHAGADVNACSKDKSKPHPPIYLACFANNYKAINHILAHKVDVGTVVALIEGLQIVIQQKPNVKNEKVVIAILEKFLDDQK